MWLQTTSPSPMWVRNPLPNTGGATQVPVCGCFVGDYILLVFFSAGYIMRVFVGGHILWVFCRRLYCVGVYDRGYIVWVVCWLLYCTGGQIQ
jgi:hypothetical protein